MKTEALNIRVSELFKKRLQEEAEKQQKTVSEYVTDILKRELEKKRGD